jgi:hypothetical protein
MMEAGDDPVALRAHADALEQKLHETMERHRSQLLNAELKAEAIKAGMVDLDGLKLVQFDELTIDDQGTVSGADALIKNLRARKPWLFSERHSSSPGSAPQALAQERKLATQMSYEEWRRARADLLKKL